MVSVTIYVVHSIGSRIRLQASETGHRAWKQQDQAEHASMGNVLMNRQTFLLWAGNTNLQMLEQLGDIRNYSMGNKYSYNIVCSSHC